MNMDVEITKATAILQAVSPSLSLRFAPTEEPECEDDGVEILRDGEATGFAFQIGRGYVCLNQIVETPEWVMYHHYDGVSFQMAAHKAAELLGADRAS